MGCHLLPGRRSTRSLPHNPKATRLALLKTAEDCFERYGVHRVTMDEVAAAAGVSRPTLYRYFRDRDSLIKSIVAHRAEKLVDRMHRLLDAQETLEDKLVTGMLFLVDVGRKDQFIGEAMRTEQVAMASQLSRDDHTAAAFAESVWGPTLKWASDEGLLPEGFDEQMAYHWLPSINFMLIGWQDYDEQPLEYRREILRRFLAPAFLRTR
jgi:AcrR family transcriptional regulator